MRILYFSTLKSHIPKKKIRSIIKSYFFPKSRNSIFLQTQLLYWYLIALLFNRVARDESVRSKKWILAIARLYVYIYSCTLWWSISWIPLSVKMKKEEIVDTKNAWSMDTKLKTKSSSGEGLILIVKREIKGINFQSKKCN